MLQGPVGSQIELSWQSHANGQIETEVFTRVMDVSAIMTAFGESVLSEDVVSARMLDSGLGYIRVTSFVMEVSNANEMFAESLQDLIDAGAQGIVIDMRGNSGGLVGLAMSMVGQFFPDYTRVLDLYYADGDGGFSYRGSIEILASENYYDGPVAVLVDEMTGSAGDMFTYAMTVDDRAIVVGNTPTGGFTGEVGDGQYRLPGSLTLQIPTGRPVNPVTGETLIEGSGVQPDIDVPLTVESILSPEDEVLQAAEAALLATLE
jgi:carboxyl-terminal processing protease